MKVFKLEWDGNKFELKQFKPPLSRQDYVNSFKVGARAWAYSNYENWVKQYYERKLV